MAKITESGLRKLGVKSESITTPEMESAVKNWKAEQSKQSREDESIKMSAQAQEQHDGITPRYKAQRDAYLKKSHTKETLEKERLAAIRELQDEGIVCSRNMTYAEIKALAGSNPKYGNALDTIKATEVAISIKADEAIQASQTAAKIGQTISNWKHISSEGYYVAWYEAAKLALLYSRYGNKENYRVICERTIPAAGYDSSNVYTMFGGDSKSISKQDLDRIITAKPSWKQLSNAFDLAGVHPDYYHVKNAKGELDTWAQKWTWDLSKPEIIF